MIWNQINICFLFLSIPLLWDVPLQTRRWNINIPNKTTSSPKGLLNPTKEGIAYPVPLEQPSNLLLIPLLIINQRFSQRRQWGNVFSRKHKLKKILCEKAKFLLSRNLFLSEGDFIIYTKMCMHVCIDIFFSSLCGIHVHDMDTSGALITLYAEQKKKRQIYRTVF